MHQQQFKYDLLIKSIKRDKKEFILSTYSAQKTLQFML